LKDKSFFFKSVPNGDDRGFHFGNLRGEWADPAGSSTANLLKTAELRLDETVLRPILHRGADFA